MAQETDKAAEPPEPAEVSEADLVAQPEPPQTPAVPLRPRAVDEGAAAAARQAANAMVEAVFHGRLTRYIAYSVLLHVVFVLLFSLPGWLAPAKAEAKADEGKSTAKPADAAQAKSATGQANDATRDPLASESGEDRVKKLLGHEAAKPQEVPKSPLDTLKEEDDILKD